MTREHSKLWLLLTAGVACQLLSVAHAATGRTSGAFDVSPTGAATYTIPIWVPPGPKGIQPNLALVYNSRLTKGVMGPGWSLGGLSAISTCSHTEAQDGVGNWAHNGSQASPGFSNSYDAQFCLNGSRLRFTDYGGNDGYGMTNLSNYQTEIADFSLIRSYGPFPGAEPSMFVVKGKDGLTYEYGTSPGSVLCGTIIAYNDGAEYGNSGCYQWLLSKVTDRNGNSYVVNYGAGVGGSISVAVPLSISYTASSSGSSSYNYAVSFGYGVSNSPDSDYTFNNNPAAYNANLLTSITVQSAGTTVRRYNLSYQDSATTSINLLNTVQECADAAALDCLLPTTINYSGADDTAANFTDGYGVTTAVSYASIAPGSNPGTAVSFPEAPYQESIKVVAQTTNSDGIGDSYTRTYSYTGAIVNLYGVNAIGLDAAIHFYSFEGFQSRTVTDSRADSPVVTNYYQTTFPFTGMVYRSDVFQHDGTTLMSKTLATPASRLLYVNPFASWDQRHLVFVSDSTTFNYEVGGTKNGQLITTAVASSTYDDYGNQTAVTTTVTDNDAGSPYAGLQWSSATARTISPNTDNWCLGLPTRVQVTNAAPGVTAITRTVDYTPDYAYCRATQEITEPSGGAYRVAKGFEFDSFGNLFRETVTGAGMAARQTTLDWGATGQFLMSVRNALGQTTYKGYDFNKGVQTTETDPNGIPISWQYDGFARKTRENRPDGTATGWSYNDCTAVACVNSNNRITVIETQLNADGSTLTDRRTYLDQFNRTLASSQKLLDGSYDFNETRYDNLGRVAQQAAPCVGTNCSTYWTVNSYDALNRVTLSQRPTSATNGNLQPTHFYYEGRTTRVVDAQGIQTTKVYKVTGDLGISQDQNGYNQSFGHDAFGSLIRVNDSLSASPLFQASYVYGIQAFQTDSNDADLGVKHYDYNALGELTHWSDANSQNFYESYDALSRPVLRTETDLTTKWFWGGSSDLHNIGQLECVTTNGSANNRDDCMNVNLGGIMEHDAYDNVGRLQTRAMSTDAAYQYDYDYNGTTGLLEALTYPTSTSSYRLKLQYAYQNGILQKVSDFNVPGTVFWTADAMNVRGQVTDQTLGTGSNRVLTHRSFDAVTGWISGIQSGTASNGTALQNEGYQYDLVGNTSQRQNNNAGLTENFYYDDVYRLDHSTLNSAENLHLHYDGSGNITQRTDVAGNAAWTYGNAAHRHAVTQAGDANNTFSYDANGNATSRNGNTIDWSSYNKPTTISGNGETVQFDYNYDHERWRVLYGNGAGSETTYFIGDLMEKVVGVGLTDYRHFIYAGGVKVAAYSRDTSGANTLRYINEDFQGGVSGIVASDGTSFVKESFTAFGNPRSTCTWDGAVTSGNQDKIASVTRHGYTWQNALGNMGLNDMNGRIQDAVTGRFLSPDPYVTEPDNTQGFNRYAYVMNNPLTYSDPSGYAPTLDQCLDSPISGTSACLGGQYASPAPPGSNGSSGSSGTGWLFAPGVPGGGFGVMTLDATLVWAKNCNGGIECVQPLWIENEHCVAGCGPNAFSDRGLSLGLDDLCTLRGICDGPVQGMGIPFMQMMGRIDDKLCGGTAKSIVCAAVTLVAPELRIAGAAAKSTNAVRLEKALASEAQMGEAGIVLAGPGSRSVFRDAERVAREYGGNAADWVKKSSSSWLSRDGTRVETHWAENIKTGERVEIKTKLPGED